MSLRQLFQAFRSHGPTDINLLTVTIEQSIFIHTCFTISWTTHRNKLKTDHWLKCKMLTPQTSSSIPWAYVRRTHSPASSHVQWAFIEWLVNVSYSAWCRIYGGNETVPDAKCLSMLGARYGFVFKKTIPNPCESMSISCQHYPGCNLGFQTLWLMTWSGKDIICYMLTFSY